MSDLHRYVALVVLISLGIGCDSSSSSSTDGGPAADGTQTGDATTHPAYSAECTAEFGAPVQLSPDVSGQSVILQGRLDHYANPLKPASAACPQGLSALVLWTADVLDFAGFVRLTDGDGEAIFCGCEAEQHSFCDRYPGGAQVRIKGDLRYLTADDTLAGCSQPPCYLLTPKGRCIIDGCDSDIHCPQSSCNTASLQCRTRPGETCHDLVGCESANGTDHYCAKTEHGFACQPPGDGSEGSVCKDTSSCTCNSCVCVYHVCEATSPALP